MEGGADLGDEFQRAGQVELAAVAEMVDVHAVDELHDEVGITLGGAAVVVDVDDVRMVERGHGLGLAFEAGERVGIRTGFRRQDLDRHTAVEAGVETLINRAHATAAEQAADLVAGIEGLGEFVRLRGGPTAGPVFTGRRA